MKLSSSSIKKFMFSQKKSFSYVPGNGNPEKIPYVSGNETSYISGSNSQSSKNKKNALLRRRNNNKIDSIENWC